MTKREEKPDAFQNGKASRPGTETGKIRQTVEITGFIWNLHLPYVPFWNAKEAFIQRPCSGF
jgi:hypothetical protein